MKRAGRQQTGKTAIELIEEAVHLLRTTATGALAIYYLGSLPFVLGVLYFWADMSRSPFARQHVVEAALGVSLLFLWMKFWQALFARKLRAHISGEPPRPLGFARGFQILYTQTTLQPTGLFVLPVAFVTVLPFAWVYSFYQNATALADGEDAARVRDVMQKSTRQARLWPRQNLVMLLCLAFFALFVFLNCCVATAMLPWLLKTLFGVETVFSRGGTAMLNTTFFAAMFGLTYLCVDPIAKAAYVLRCFYGESVQSGADLRAELKHFVMASQRGAACALLVFVLAVATASRATEAAAPSPPQPTPTSVAPADLDRAIGGVIQQRKYTWRMPREKTAEADEPKKGFLSDFFERIGRMLRDWARAVSDWLERLLQKLFPRSRLPTPSVGSGYGWIVALEILLYLLVAAVLAAIAVLLYRFWKNRGRKPEVIAADAIQSAPDLTDENIGAEQLPEDGWTKLARELLARGEFRLALRAFYLASLAHLAERNLIALARFKSNRDYERELRRRAHSFPNLLSLFGENVSAFDRVWYGTHEASDELVLHFAENVNRIKAGG